MMNEQGQQVRLVEAILFAAAEPLDEATIAGHLPTDTNVKALIGDVAELYANRGVSLVQVGGKWAFRTAEDLAPRLRIERDTQRKLSRAAVETLAIVAYHQPVTRAEIEDIRGVTVSRGTLDVLVEAGWVRPGRRRNTPGRPLTWVTTEAFLDHFGLAEVRDLPGLKELKLSGLLDARPAIGAYAATAAGAAPDEELDAALDDELDDADQPLEIVEEE